MTVLGSEIMNSFTDKKSINGLICQLSYGLDSMTWTVFKRKHYIKHNSRKKVVNKFRWKIHQAKNP
jgi:hypothetical protein